MFKTLLLIGTGGFLGSALRFLFYHYIDKYVKLPFPLATFTVNITGSLLTGLVIGIALRENSMGTAWQMFLAAGFCGGFTTFSSFSLDGIGLIQQGRFTTLLLYITTSIILGLAATGLGIALTKPSIFYP